MRLEFHGAVRTVTGSQHLLKVNGLQILLDCGIYHGRRAESYARNQQLPYDPSRIDLLVLSHAHIDHSGNIPNLVKNGFRGDILGTYATRDLCAIMLRDSAKIQEYDIEYLNRKRHKRGEPPLEPIYTTRDALESLKHFVGLGYDRKRAIAPGVSLTFLDAGHMLGSAIVVLDIDDAERGQPVRLVFSGDLGRPRRPLLRDPETVAEADILLIESTYGTREHEVDAVSNDELERLVNETWKRGGKLIVPAFAVGRTQELVYRLHQLVAARRIPLDLPIFVDSPLAIDATAVYRLHPEGYNDALFEFMLNNRDKDPFGFAMMRYTRHVEQSKALNVMEGPAVIISASGMAESGRILHHLIHNVEDPRSTILIVGWQAPYTLGRRLVEGTRRVRILGDEYTVRAHIAKINGFSAHADRSELLDWVGAFQKKPRHTFVVHGDEEVSLAFAETLRREAGLPEVTVPHLGEGFDLG